MQQSTTNVAIYARVSTLNHKQDVSMQLLELREHCQRRGWNVSAEYVDAGISGAKDSRPELNRLMLGAKRRQFDVVVVWKLDRFGRSLRHLVNALAELEAVGVAFVSLTDNLDLTTPAGRLMFQVIAAMGEFERELIRQRVKAGLRNAKSKGVRLGRPPVVADARRIASARAQGHGWKRIAKEMGLGVSTVRRIDREARQKGSEMPAERAWASPAITTHVSAD